MLISELVKEVMPKRPELFVAGMHVQMLINRDVGNTNKGSKRWVNKLVSFNEKDYEQNCTSLLEQMYSIDNDGIRLYASINPRCYDRVTKEFLAKAILDGNKLFYKNIHAKFISIAMKPEQRERTLWLIDVDDKELIPKTDELLKESYVALSYETPNGKHYIVSHVDMRPFKEMEGVDVHRDGLMLLHSKEMKYA